MGGRFDHDPSMIWPQPDTITHRGPSSDCDSSTWCNIIFIWVIWSTLSDTSEMYKHWLWNRYRINPPRNSLYIKGAFGSRVPWTPGILWEVTKRVSWVSKEGDGLFQHHLNLVAERVADSTMVFLKKSLALNPRNFGAWCGLSQPQFAPFSHYSNFNWDRVPANGPKFEGRDPLYRYRGGAPKNKSVLPQMSSYSRNIDSTLWVGNWISVWNVQYHSSRCLRFPCVSNMSNGHQVIRLQQYQRITFKTDIESIESPAQ